MSERVVQRRSLRLFNILENINHITDLYNQLNELDEQHIELSKNTVIKINNKSYTFYYLMKRKFYFINKNNIKLSIIFKLKTIDNVSNFCAIIILLSGNSICNSHKCNELFCTGGKHYFEKSTDAKYVFKTENAAQIMEGIENKINDYRNCINCLKIWDMNSIDKVEGVDDMDLEICDNCNFTIHMNEKTKETNGDCPICLKPMYNFYDIKTECGHCFHNSCLEQWLETKTNCPLCRTTLI